VAENFDTHLFPRNAERYVRVMQLSLGAALSAATRQSVRPSHASDFLETGSHRNFQFSENIALVKSN